MLPTLKKILDNALPMTRGVASSLKLGEQKGGLLWRARAYKGGLGAEPPVGIQGAEPPGGESGGQSPLKLMTF